MAAAAVEPTVGAETQAVGEVVIARPGYVEAVENGLGRTVGNVVMVAVGNKQQPGRADCPEPTVSDLNTREHLERVGEDCAVIEPPVAVGVAEDQHPVPQ